MPLKTDNGLMNVEEVCVFFGGTEHPVSVRTIYRWVQKGKLARPVKIGGLSRWRRKDVEHALRDMEDREV